METIKKSKRHSRGDSREFDDELNVTREKEIQCQMSLSFADMYN